MAPRGDKKITKKKKEKDKPNEYSNIESPDQRNEEEEEEEENLGETIPAQRNGIRFFMRDRQIMDVYRRVSFNREN